MDWLGDFFGALPDVAKALWTFGGAWAGLAVSVGSLVAVGALLFAAMRLRDRLGWVSATFGAMAATIAAWWAFGILPSAWIYFADGQRDLMEGVVVPSEISVGSWVIASNFYQVFRDSVVMVETFVAMAAFVVFALAFQKRNPRTLAEGEEARPQSGGYK